jgi:hypothetical protein
VCARRLIQDSDERMAILGKNLCVKRSFCVSVIDSGWHEKGPAPMSEATSL